MDKYTHRHKENVKGMFLWGSIIVAIFLIVFALTSCGLAKYYYPKISKGEYFGEVVICENEKEIPQDAVLLGTIYTGDSGFTSTNRCTYERCLQTAIEMTRKMGGNYLLIANHIRPTFPSKCHGIGASVYYKPK